MVRQLCVWALSRGVGSMEYVDSLLIMEDEDHNDSGNANAFSEDSAGLSQAQQTELSTGSGGSQHPRPPSEPTPNWCKCQQCQPMAQEVENRCCGYRNCITNKRRFQKLCLDPEVLELCIRNRADIRNDRENNNTSSFRKPAYRQFILEKYGRLGKGNRKVAASCVVLRVRRQYPSPTGIYLGFRAEWCKNIFLSWADWFKACFYQILPVSRVSLLWEVSVTSLFWYFQLWPWSR